MPSTGLGVDTSNRNDVIAFYNAVYGASQPPQATIGWTGSYGTTCQPGTLSATFQADVERRINFYRAMCGLEASALINTGASVVIQASDPVKPPAGTLKESAAQRAALAFSYADTVSHNPSSLPCLGSQGWNAANKGSLALGLFGTAAIDAYMRENDPTSLSSWSDTVGHRRWILKQGSSDFATGDVPGGSGRRPVNVLYVVQNPEEVMPFVPQFVSWPSSGFFPDSLVPTQWSLSYPGADFSSANVSMSDDAGVSLPVVLTNRTDTNQGDNSIVWRVSSKAAQTTVSSDTTYRLTISGIKIDGETVGHTYSVTVIDTDRIVNPPVPLGTSNLPPTGAIYFFDPVPEAEEHRYVVAKTLPAAWIEGAEDGSSAAIIDEHTPGYELQVAVNNPAYAIGNFWLSGAKAFRLAMPFESEIVPQIFRIDRQIIPQPGCKINYYVRRGFVDTSNSLALQISTDGSIWTTLDTLNGLGAATDPTFNLRTVNVPASTGSFQIRFMATRPPGSQIYDPIAINVAGFFIDDISVTNAEWITSSKSTVLPPAADRLVLDAVAAGEDLDVGEIYRLGIEAVLGGRAYAAEELKTLTVGTSLTGYALWQDAMFPVLGGGFEDDDDGDGIANGIEYAFDLDPIEPTVLGGDLSLSAGQVMLETPLVQMRAGVNYQAERSSDLHGWTADDVTVTHAGGMLRAQTPLSDEPTFLRWKITEE